MEGIVAAPVLVWVTLPACEVGPPWYRWCKEASPTGAPGAPGAGKGAVEPREHDESPPAMLAP